MELLEEKIGYRFQDRSLLLTALTHSSYANEQHGQKGQSYERLEFLGDSILGYVTAEFLYRQDPELPEGSMTRLRAELVCESSLHAVAESLALGEWMRLGKGEEHSGGRSRPSILADMVESLIAAIYLDAGLEEARRFVQDKVLSEQCLDRHRSHDYKTLLQEQVQKKSDQQIRYELVEASGPDHRKFFRYRVLINGQSAGEGSGYSKKEAEQQAAREALEALEV